MESTDTLKLPPMPARIAKLPRNARGYPVPFFVAWIDGKPDFRMVRPETLRDAMKRKVCWICGQPLNTQSTFVLGPMCCVNRTNSEPPSHRACAEFAVQACPFMLRPNMERREDEITRSANGTAGIMVPRNPGVMALWSTKSWSIFPDPAGRPLFRVGDPTHVSWWREGRAATFLEAQESIVSGSPILLSMCANTSERDECKTNIAAAVRLAKATT